MFLFGVIRGVGYVFIGLLYTSDAADEEDILAVGGVRVI